MINKVIGFILNFVWEIFFQDADDDSEEENVKIPKVEQYAEEIVSRLSDKTFQMHFRITPNTFEVLFAKLHSIEDNTVHIGCKEISLEKQLIVTIWYLANIESFR